MARGRLKYYLKKPKGEITKDILLWILVAGGMIVLGATPPVQALLENRKKKYNRQSAHNAFSRLKKQGALIVERHHHQYQVSLTEEGKKKAGWLQINDLRISKPRKWDGKWRLLIFDVEQAERWRRDILRSFLARLECVLLQKSVWVHPYECRAEVEVLREFLGLDEKHLKYIEANITGKDAERLKRHFHLQSYA
jgi:DNA-binding transcriptional regulator PaaX